MAYSSTSLLAFVGTAIAAAPVIKLFYSMANGHRTKKRTKLVKLIDEAKRLGLDEEYIHHLTDRYKQQTIFEMTGIDMKLSNQEIILRNATLKNYKTKDVKRMAEYYKYENNQLTVEFGTSGKIAFVFCLVFAIFMAIFSLTCIYTAFESDVPSGNFWVVLLFGIAYFTGSILFYRLTVSPYLLAKVLKQELEEESLDFESAADQAPTAMKVVND